MIKHRENENLFVVGFMGAGKTTIGATLAKKLERDFIDTDQAIVQTYGKSISEIFSERGERFFRDYETEIFADIASEVGLVIALGGGTLESSKNRHIVRSTGKSIYLRWSFKNLFGRLNRNGERPLVIIKNKQQLRDLFESRKCFFEDSDLILDCELYQTPHDIVEQIISRIEKG